MDKRLIGVAIVINSKSLQQWMDKMVDKEKFDGAEEVVITLDGVSYSMSFKELKERLEK